MVNARKAQHSDSKIIYEWRNDELTRKMSHKTDPIEWERHRKWFTSSLTNPNRLLLICEAKSSNESIAVVCFDIEADRALVSINLSPPIRGEGMASLCLTSAIHHFSNTYPKITMLDAEIKSVNTASQRAFERVGFLKVKRDKYVMHYEFSLVS